MTNVNVVSSPNVKGNIGSCTTQVESVYGARDFWTVEIDQIATNSCTGKVTHYGTWQYSGMAGIIMFSFMIGIIMIGTLLVAVFTNRY